MCSFFNETPTAEYAKYGTLITKMFTTNMAGVNRNNKEDGSALIVVLGLLAILTLLVTHLSTSSMIAAKEATVVAERSALRHKAESACGRAFWNHLIDRRKFRNRNLTGDNRSEKELNSGDRWRADGRLHKLGTKSYPVEVRLVDNNNGIAVNPANPEKTLRDFLKPPNLEQELTTESSGNTEYIEAIDKFCDVLQDYVDSDGQDMKHLHGKEQPGYADQGFPDMPRNDKLQLAAELLWIEGLEETPPFKSGIMTPKRFLDVVRLDKGGRNRGSNKPNFFAVDSWFIKRHAELTGNQMAELEDALSDWRENGGNFLNTLSPEVASKLRRTFSFTPSGELRLVATAFAMNKNIERTVVLERDAKDFTVSPETNDRNKNKVIKNSRRYYP